MSGFKDHFSGQSVGYGRYRPRYPDRLFAHVASVAPGRNLAWDCATGNGQAAVGLAESFERVVATDASLPQVSRALARKNVLYVVAPAEQAPLADRSVDAVTVAQALHWFDHRRFHAEVARVLRPQGIVAAWCYLRCGITPQIDSVVDELYTEIVGRYWPPERGHVEDGYRSIPFPFAPVASPSIELTVSWNLDRFLGYLGTWSAVQRYRDAIGSDPIAVVRHRILNSWGDPAMCRLVTWPLSIRIGRPDDAAHASLASR